MAMKDEQFPKESDDLAVREEPSPVRVDSAGPPPRKTSSSNTSLSDGGDNNRHGKKSDAGLFERLGQFIRETRAEMRRVSWPSAKEVKNTTIITIIAVIFFAIYLFTVDQAFTYLLAQFSRFLNWLLSSIA